MLRTIKHSITLTVILALSIVYANCNNGATTAGPTTQRFVFDKDPAWTPDSKYILYDHREEQINFTATLSFSSGIWAIDVETGEDVQLVTNLTFDDQNLSFDVSNDGGKIVVTKGPQLVITEFLSNPVEIGAQEAVQQVIAAYPKWSPDGEWITYELPLPGSAPSQVWIADKNGENAQFVRLGSTPEWHPEGTRIIAAVVTPDSILETQFMMFDPFDSLAAVDTLDVIPGSLNLFPSFSPDGSQIVFQSQGTGNSFIHIMNTDGTGEITQLSPGGQPVWSPDGNLIAFRLGTDNLDTRIFLIEPDGSNIRQLTILLPPNPNK